MKKYLIIKSYEFVFTDEISKEDLIYAKNWGEDIYNLEDETRFDIEKNEWIKKVE